MTILAMQKVTLASPAKDRDTVLAGLQELGLVQLIPLVPKPAALPDRPAIAPAEDAYKALRWISDVPVRRRQVRDEGEFGFDFDRIVQLALANKQRQRELEDRCARLRERIEWLTPWGDFHLPASPDELGGNLLWFYQMPLHELDALERGLTAFEEVHRDNRYCYLVAISKQEPHPGMAPVPRIRCGSRSLSELQERLEHTEIQLEDAEVEHQTLSRWIWLISRNLARAEDRSALEQAGQEAWSDEHICLVQGWAPQCDLERLQGFADAHRLALVAEDPLPGEQPPTYMKNPPPLNGGQDLVRFYQTPGYHDWDPSRLVFLSFALFFAMILADAGYALVLALGLAWYWRRLAETQRSRRLRVLMAAVLSSSVVYGALVGSWFGIAPDGDNPLAALKLLDIHDFDAMMTISIGIGCLHLAVANGVVAWRIGHFPAAGRPLGWIAAILGGYLLYLGDNGGSNTGLVTSGYVVLTGGLGLVMACASERSVIGLRSAALRLFDGLVALTRVSKMFGDILSYLRLFALGLASASLAMTFNQLATQVRETLPGEGLLLAILILVLGHAINLVLGILSGFIHGLRLNFIEFFNWGLSDEGYPFRPFAKKEVQS